MFCHFQLLALCTRAAAKSLHGIAKLNSPDMSSASHEDPPNNILAEILKPSDYGIPQLLSTEFVTCLRPRYQTHRPTFQTSVQLGVWLSLGLLAASMRGGSEVVQHRVVLGGQYSGTCLQFGFRSAGPCFQKMSPFPVPAPCTRAQHRRQVCGSTKTQVWPSFIMVFLMLV